jgi:RNA polymerase sigma-70 factor (ECF subfamily)
MQHAGQVTDGGGRHGPPPAVGTDRTGGGPGALTGGLAGTDRPVSARVDAAFVTGEHLTDTYLVGRAKAGSTDAFEVLVGRHADRAYRVALRLTGVPHLAEDIAQEAFVSAWRGIGGFRGDASFSTWLSQIVVNGARQQGARRKPTSQLTGDEPLATDQQPEEVVQSRARDAALHDAVRALPFDQQTALVLVQFEGMSYEQASQVLNVKVSTVRGRIARARQSLLGSLQGWR